MKDFTVTYRRIHQLPVSITQCEHPKINSQRVQAKNEADARKVVRREEGPIQILRVNLTN